MLRIRNLESGYGKLRVLKRISMHVNPGEIVTIIGPNGAGKTTLLHTVSGLIKPFTGSIELSRRDVTGLRAETIVESGCSLVPEGRQLFSTMTVRENLILGGYLRLRLRKNRKAVIDELKGIYAVFPRLQERQSQLAGTLSGGEQQMLAIGRALMSQPHLIMMDEPSMGLAPLVVRGIFDVIRRLREQGRTVLLVEQNARAALGLADRGYVMETGGFVLEGTAEELLENPDVQRAYLGKDYASVGE